MAVLKVLLDRKEIYNIPLARGREYFIGRAENSDIILNKSSISRQHMKVFFDGQNWQIELISKYSTYSSLGDGVTNLILEKDQSFVIEGYEFRYLEEVETTKAPPKENAPVVEAPAQPEFVPKDGSNLSPDATVTNMEKKDDAPNDNTAVSTQMASPCLHAINEKTGEEVLYTLDGNHWVSGRSSSCQIRLKETKASRQHFEIYKTTTGFEIIDLGSSNGTYLNSKRLVAQTRTPLTLGDEIRIGKTVLTFEIRNSKYADQLAQIPASLIEDEDLDENIDGEIGDQVHDADDGEIYEEDFVGPRSKEFKFRGESPAVVKYQEKNNSSLDKKTYIRIGVGVVLIFLIYLGLSGTQQSSPQSHDSSSVSNGSLTTNKPPGLEELNPEQKKLAENTYQLSKNFFLQQKYQSAKAEVQKLHAMLPFYKDSRDMEKFIDQAIQIETDRERIRIEQEKQLKIAEHVKENIRNCEGQIGPNTTVSQIQSCLQPAVEMDPENPMIQKLIDKVTAQDELRRDTKIAKENRDSQIRRGQALFAEAQRAEQKSNYLQAIDLYNKLVNSNLPDPQGNKAKARTAIANLNLKIKNGITQLLAKAEQFKAQEKYRESWEALTQAMRWDPTDSRILQTMASVESELKKKMKALYNDGVLEENIGNLESAKLKWKAIRAQDLKNGDYYKKAESKLKKYGD